MYFCFNKLNVLFVPEKTPMIYIFFTFDFKKSITLFTSERSILYFTSNIIKQTVILTKCDGLFHSNTISIKIHVKNKFTIKYIRILLQYMSFTLRISFSRISAIFYSHFFPSAMRLMCAL